MSTYISHLQLANAVLCLLLAAQWLFLPAHRPAPKRLLALNYLLYAHQSLALVAILHGQGALPSVLRPLAAMWIGPAMYVYFCCVRRADAQVRARDLAHFAWGTLAFCLLFGIPPLRFALDWAIPASFVAYVARIAIQARRDRLHLAHLGEHAPSAQRWLTGLMLMALVNIALEVAVTLEMQQGVRLRDSVSLFAASAAFLLLNTATVMAALSRSHWLEWMLQFSSPVQPSEPAPADRDALATLFRRWEDLVEREALHTLEFGITLPQAAKRLGVPARQLSNAVNHVYGKSFSVHLNDRRIQAACQLLRERPELPIIEVMQAAGFSSKSNFNKEFLRVTGQSPSQFRQAPPAPTAD